MKQTSNKQVTPSIESRYRKAQKRMIVCFCVLIIGISAFLSIVLMNRFDNIIRNKTATLISADTRQLELNINSYLEKIETTATLLFSDEVYFQYDATDASMDKYDMVKAEEVITNRITDLGLLENYSDFAIVYANDHTVGWFSNTTQALLKDQNRYETFASHIIRNRTEDGWFFGLNGNTDRLYYVKRVNANALLVVSFYGRELETAFDYPKELKGMSIRLTDEDAKILYSTDVEEIGGLLPEEIAKYVSENGHSSVIKDQNLINTNICHNGWKVVCSIPLQVILKESRSLMTYAIGFTIFITVVFLALAFVIFRGINKSLTGVFLNLAEKAETDQLSGLLNKNSYGEQAKKLLENKKADELALMIIMDVDYFKPINDNLGHARGDVVISKFAALLSREFPDRFLLGRIGGDEFSAFCICSADDRIDMRQKVEQYLDRIRTEFLQEFAEEHQRFGTSMSAGSVLTEEEQVTFASLYQKADTALYSSKDNGKGRTTWYGEEEK